MKNGVLYPAKEDAYRGWIERAIELRKNPETFEQEKEYQEAVASRTEKHLGTVFKVAVPSTILALYGLVRKCKDNLEEDKREERAVATGPSDPDFDLQT